MKIFLYTLVSLIVIGCTISPKSSDEGKLYYMVKNSDGTEKKVMIRIIDTLSTAQMHDLKAYLSFISGEKFDANSTIVIIFIDNDPRIYRKNYQVPWDIFYGNLQEDLSNHGKAQQLYIINRNVKDLYYYHDDKINWIVDTQNLIRNTFFDNRGLNGGFIIIKPDGAYFRKVGEYSRDEVIKTFKVF